MVTKISLQIVLAALSVALFQCVCHGHIALLLKAGLQFVFGSVNPLPTGKTSRVRKVTCLQNWKLALNKHEFITVSGHLNSLLKCVCICLSLKDSQFHVSIILVHQKHQRFVVHERKYHIRPYTFQSWGCLSACRCSKTPGTPKDSSFFSFSRLADLRGFDRSSPTLDASWNVHCSSQSKTWR